MADITIPIKGVKADQGSAVVMAADEIERFLSHFYPLQTVRKLKSADIIAGMWVSRVKGLHDSDDFLHLTHDFLDYVMSGGNRSLVSDRISFFFSGFMPSYGAARTFLGIVDDGGKWPDVRAFMHFHAYGNAKNYVEGFDWGAGQQKTQTEADAWLKILSDQEKKLGAAASGALAFVAPGNSSWLADAVKTGSTTGEGQAAKSALRLAIEAITKFPVVRSIALLAYSPSLNAGEREYLQARQKQQALAKQNTLAIPAPLEQVKLEVNTQTVVSMPQIEKNKQNGEKCENNGYALMENSLRYRRLIQPPKGKGLDGLFEKTPPMNAPNPAPLRVAQPAPGGELKFIPESARPPQPQYDYANLESGVATYPRFVVFEAKNIDRSFQSSDEDGIKKAAQRSLGETIKDGTQMGTDWISRRIPHALKRNVRDGEMSAIDGKKTQANVRRSGYARWIFVCLPGPVGSQSKLFVFIDVDQAGIKMDRPEPEMTPQETQDNGYN